MSARSRMRMRATVERDTRVTNDYGDDGVPSWQTLFAALPCHAWTRNASGDRFGEEVVTSDYYPVMMVPLGTDIKETDRVVKIVDLRGNEAFGMMDVGPVIRRTGFLEVRMKYHA